jgi:hypothetical protein
MSDASLGALIVVSVTSMFTLLTTVATFMMNWVLKQRDREWQLEDRLLATTTHKVAVESVIQAKAAYKEANDVNSKIKELHQELSALTKIVGAAQGLSTQQLDPGQNEAPTTRAGGQP